MPYAINVDGLGEITIPDKASDVDLLTNVLVEKYLSGQVDDTDAQIAMLDGLLEMSMNRGGGEPLPPVETGPPDRGYLTEAGAGLWSGAKYTLGAGLSGIERLAEQWGIDPTGEDAGWLRQAGDALKEGAAEIKASPDLPEWYFKTFNAFGSALSFMAVGVAASPLGGLPALGIMGAFAGGTGVDEALDRAEEGGASPEQMNQIATIGLGIGFSELAAPVKILRGLRKAFRLGKNDTTKGLAATSTEDLRRKTIDGVKAETLAKNIGVDPKPFRTYGKNVAQAIGLEGSQEAVAAIAQNALEKYMYSPDTPLVNTEVFEEGLYGGAAGAMMQGILGVYGVRKSRKFRKKVDEFMESDTYKGIDDTALKAVNTLDDPDATEEQKATATDQLARADSMMELALRQNVFNSQEVKDYLKLELEKAVDEDGVRVYSDTYIKGVLENEEALKDFYIRHTLNPNTKHEPEAEDIIYGTINPATGEEFTFSDMEELRKTKSGEELVTEVKLRKAAIDRGESQEAQLSRIYARNVLGIGDRRLNNVRKIFEDANKEILEGTTDGTKWNVDEQMFKYVQLITLTEEVEENTDFKQAKAKVDKSLRDNREMGLDVYAAKLSEIMARKEKSKVQEKEDESQKTEDVLKDRIPEDKWAQKEKDNRKEKEAQQAYDAAQAEVLRHNDLRDQARKEWEEADEAYQNAPRDSALEEETGVARDEARARLNAAEEARLDAITVKERADPNPLLVKDVQIVPDVRGQGAAQLPNETDDQFATRIKREADERNLLKSQFETEIRKERGLPEQGGFYPDVQAEVERRYAQATAISPPDTSTIKGPPPLEGPPPKKKRKSFNPFATETTEEAPEQEELVLGRFGSEEATRLKKEHDELLSKRHLARLDPNDPDYGRRFPEPQFSSAVEGDDASSDLQQVDAVFIKMYDQVADALNLVERRNEYGEPVLFKNGIRSAEEALSAVKKRTRTVEGIAVDENGIMVLSWQDFFKRTAANKEAGEGEIKIVEMVFYGKPEQGYPAFLQAIKPIIQRSGVEVQSLLGVGLWTGEGQTLFPPSLAGDEEFRARHPIDYELFNSMMTNLMEIWVENPIKNQRDQKEQVDTPSPSVISPATRSYTPLDNNLFMKLGIISDKDIEDITGRIMHMVTITNPERKNWKKEGPDDYGNITYRNIDPQTNDLKEIRFVREYGPESSEKQEWIASKQEELQSEITKIQDQIGTVHNLSQMEADESALSLAIKYNQQQQQEDVERKGLTTQDELLHHTTYWTMVTENKFDLEELQEDLAAKRQELNDVGDERYFGQDLGGEGRGFLGMALTGSYQRLGRFIAGGKEELFGVAPVDEGVLIVNVGLIEYSELKSRERKRSERFFRNFEEMLTEEIPDFETLSPEEQQQFLDEDDARMERRKKRKEREDVEEKELDDLVGVKALSRFIQTSVHEAWHFAREFVFTAEQLAFFNRVVTPELAIQNGWRSLDYYRGYYANNWDNNVKAVGINGVKRKEKAELNKLIDLIQRENPQMERSEAIEASTKDIRSYQIMGNRHQEGRYEEGYWNEETGKFITNPVWAAKRFPGEQRSKYINDRILDEAQAYMFEKWDAGVVLKGLTPRARSLMQMLRDFFMQIKNILQDVGIIRTSEQVENENAKDEGIQLKRADAKRLQQEWEDFKSGKTASRVGAEHYEASVANVYRTLPGMAPSIAESFDSLKEAVETAKGLTKKLKDSGSAIPVEGQPESGEQAGEAVMKDLSNFAKIIAHTSNISEKNILFKAVYNQVQERVQYRNTIKMVADVMIEKVGKFGGILKLKRESLKTVQDLTILTDAVGVEPEFTDIEGDNPSVTVSFTGKDTNKIGDMYGNLDGDVNPYWAQKGSMTLQQWLDIHDPQNSVNTSGSEGGLARLLEDAGIDFDAVTKTVRKRQVGISAVNVDPATLPVDPEWLAVDEMGGRSFFVPEVVYTYTKTGPEAAAFAGTYYAGKHVGEEKYKAIVTNLLNTGTYEGIGELLGIETGQDSSYETMQEQIKDFLTKVSQTEVPVGPLVGPEGQVIINELTGEPEQRTVPIWTHSRGINEQAYQIYQNMYEAHVAQQAAAQGVSLEEAIVGPHILGKPLVNKGKVKQADNFLEILNAVAYEKRPGYFPHLRFGDKAIAVYKQRTDEDGKLLTDRIEDKVTGIIKEVPRRGDMIRLETVESKAQRLLGGVPLVGDKLNRQLKEEQHEIARDLRRKFSESDNFIVTEFDMTLDNLRTGKDGRAIMQAMGTIENLAAIFQGHVFDNKGEKIESKTKSDNRREQLLDSYVDFLKERTTESRAQTLLKKRKGIPGFINERNNDGDYFRVAFQRFIDSSSNVASSLMVEPDLLKAMDKLDRVYGTTSNYSKKAHNLFDYINNPNNESTLLRAYAFHWFLGYNLSSAGINLTQTIQGTVPILSSITGVTKGTGGVLKAGTDSIKLYKHMMAASDVDIPRLGKYGFEFHTTELRLNPETNQMEPYSKLDLKRKPQWMDPTIKDEAEAEKSGEFGMLAGLFKKGSIQPIQNMDLGAGELSKRLKSNSTRFLADSSGYAFGMVENVNRITAALSFYRAAKTTANGKNPDLKANFKAYARSTRFGELDLDAMDDETFARTMAEMGVEKTQFFMGKENRPWFFQGRIMSAVSQFQTFLWQMVGLYADALIKSMGGRLQNFTPEDQALIKRMARTQLGMMVLTVMAFGGAMGLPFMENFKQLWRLITQNFGDEVGQDFEQGTREVLGPALGYNATDMLLRGLLRGLQVDISRRASYGDIIPLRLFMGGDPVDYTGPAISRIVDTIEGVNSSYDRGDIFGTVAALFPIAAGNLWRASRVESSYGTFTQRGQQLLPAGTLGFGEKVLYGLGFNPLTVARARARRGQENYYQYRAANGKEYYTARMATWLSGYMGDVKKGNLSSAQNNLQKYYRDYLKVLRHDMDNMATPSKQYNININSVLKRAQRAHDAMSLVTGPRVRKKVRPEIQRHIMEGAVAANQ